MTENLGNLLFMYGAQNIFKDATGSDMQSLTVTRQPECQLIIYPCANQINPAVRSLSYNKKFFESQKTPFILLGLGTQINQPADFAEIDISPLIHSLHSSTIDYLKYVAINGKGIGVRGPWSQFMFKAITGIEPKITTCPSLFANRAPSSALAGLLESRYNGLKSGKKMLNRIAVHPQHGSAYQSEYHKASERFLWNLAKTTNGALYVVNGPSSFFSLARNRLFEKMHYANYRSLCAFLEPEIPYDEVLGTLIQNSIAFPGVLGWLDWLSTCDLCIGKRIHGAIAAMQAGCPAVLITHDSRTKELASQASVPSITISDLEEIVSVCHSGDALHHILERIEFDSSDWIAKRESARHATIDMICSNGFSDLLDDNFINPSER